MERLNPIDTPSESAKLIVTASTVDMLDNEEGKCPECGNQMALTACGPVPVFACLEHRIVLPLKEK